MKPISLCAMLRRFWKRTSLTWVLVLLEGASLVAMPKAIGWAVDDLLSDSLAGLLKLGGICLALLVVGAARRFYDTRAYAGIYRTMADELFQQEENRGSGLSTIVARSNLFTELMTFLEDDIPGILLQFIGVVGTLAIILTVGWQILVACLIAIALIMLIYALSGKRIFDLNKGENDELERRVDVFASRNRTRIRTHLRDLMRWEIRLSDLETINFPLIWIVLAGVLIFTVVFVTTSGGASFGQIVATVMYVFGLTEGLIALPLYYQQLVRLKEISARLAHSGHPRETDLASETLGFKEAP